MHVSIKDGKLIVSLSVWNRLAAATFKDLEIPTSAIKAISARPEEADHLIKGIKVGTHIPGLLTAGNFYHLDDKKDFYYVKSGGSEHCVKIQLTKEDADHIPWGNLYLEAEEDESAEECRDRLLKDL